MWENFRNSHIQDGGGTPYWKSFLAITRLHIVRLRQNLVFGDIIARVQWFGDENVKFSKSNMADSRHFENRYSSISQPRIARILRRRKFWARQQKRDKNSEIPKFKMAEGWSFLGYNLAAYCPIKTKYGVRGHNRSHVKGRWWKCPISKIQHCGRPPFWKSLYSPYLSRKSSELHEIQYPDTNFTADNGKDKKNQKFANSKWRMDAALKITFSL